MVDTYVYKPATGINAALSKQVLEGDKSLRVRLRGRIMAADMNGSGSDQIIVTKNIMASILEGIKEAEMNILAWTGARLEQRSNIKDIPGAVLDFQLVHQDQGGAQILTLVRTKGNLFTKDRQQVMSYSMK